MKIFENYNTAKQKYGEELANSVDHGVGSTDHSLSHRTDQRLIIFREFFKISLTP